MTKDMQSLLADHLDKTYSPCASICRALLAQLKTLPTYHSSKTYQDIFYFAHQAEIETGSADLDMLNEFERVMQLQELSTPIFIKGEPFLFSKGDQFLLLTTEYELVTYVGYRLDNEPFLINECQEPLLSVALRSSWSSCKMVQMLLRRGANPNQQYQSSTVWRHFLSSCALDIEAKMGLTCRQELLKMLLSSGADINEVCRGSWSWYGLLLMADWFVLSRTFVHTLGTLLAHGLDPNQKFRSSTVWESFLTWIVGSRLNEVSHNLDWKFAFEAMTLFLRYGANPCSSVQNESYGDSVIRSWSVSELIETKFEDMEQAILRRLLDAELQNVKRHDQYCSIHSASSLEGPLSSPNQRAPFVRRVSTPATYRSYPRSRGVENGVVCESRAGRKRKPY